MASKLAKQQSLHRASRLAALTPAERVALAERLARDGLAAFIAAHGVDRPTALHLG